MYKENYVEQVYLMAHGKRCTAKGGKLTTFDLSPLAFRQKMQFLLIPNVRDARLCVCTNENLRLE